MNYNINVNALLNTLVQVDGNEIRVGEDNCACTCEYYAIALDGTIG